MHPNPVGGSSCGKSRLGVASRNAKGRKNWEGLHGGHILAVLLVLNGCSWALVGWIAGIAVYRMRSRTFPITGVKPPGREDSRVS
jgi:hypothetical protein